MDRHTLLAAVSAAQLTAGLGGLVIAARRRLPADLLVSREPRSPEHLRRDAVLLGTAQSAPLHMMGVQAWATGVLLTRQHEPAARTLGILGILMTAGCLVERNSPLWPGHGDRLATPVFLAGLAGATGMAILGLQRPGDARSS